MKNTFLRRSICFCLACLSVLMLLPVRSHAETTGTLTVTVCDSNGTPITDAIVIVTDAETNHYAVNEGNGTYLFTKPDSPQTTYGVHVACDGYYAQVSTVSADTASLTVTLEACVDTNTWQEFGVYYKADGTLPTTYYAAGSGYSVYGPSGDNTPLVTVNIDITRLASSLYSDVVIYEEPESSGGWFTASNTYQFYPNDPSSEEADRLAAAALFWDAVKECMDFSSEQAFRATGLFDVFIAYCLKEETSWFGSSAEQHMDGILDAQPPVYTVEMYCQDANGDQAYFGGFLTDSRISDAAFPTVDDVLQAYEDHLNQDIVWTASDGSYTGSYVADSTVYTLTVTQTNTIDVYPDGSELGYDEKKADSYYVAIFEMTIEEEEQVQFTVTYTDGAAYEIIFTDQVQTAATGDSIDRFTGSTDREGYVFQGWLLEGGDGTLLTDTEISAMTVGQADIVFVASYIPDLTVTFYTNIPGVDEGAFRTYYPLGKVLPEDGTGYHLTADNSVDTFYDIPEFDYYTHNGYIFKGWYLDQDNENDTRPIDWSASYTEDTDVYAHWIYVADVAQEDDGKQNIADQSYAGFDLVGTQIRYNTTDDGYYDYTDAQTGADSGLRFVAVISEDVWQQVCTVHADNAASAQYGIVMAKSSTAQKYQANSGTAEADYELWCKHGVEVNGLDTTLTYKYVKNLGCTSTVGDYYTGSGIAGDHFNGTAYRLYTAVLTYTSCATQEALEAAYQVEYLARAYIRYTDANGLERIHYNNYAEETALYGGCSASYNEVVALTEAWEVAHA